MCSVPGTNYAMAQGPKYLDTHQQQNCIKNIVKASDHQSSDVATNLDGSLSSQAPVSPILCHEPARFITDTDSVACVIDTGANKIVVNDARLLTDLNIIAAKINGIGGKSIVNSGVGQLTLTLKSDSGQVDTVLVLKLSLCRLVPTISYHLRY